MEKQLTRGFDKLTIYIHTLIARFWEAFIWNIHIIVALLMLIVEKMGIALEIKCFKALAKLRG